MRMVSEILNLHRERYGTPHVLVKSPGRVNIIGEHIDYNGGKVLPFAVEQATYVSLSENRLDHHRIFSKDYGYTELKEPQAWSRYIMVTMQLLSEKYDIQHYDVTIVGDLPIGAGMSSSSSLVLGLLKAVSEVADLDLDHEQLLNLSSSIEYGAGVEGGKMDQLSILHGQAGKALFIDCKTHEIDYVDLPEDLKWYILDTGMKHDLATSDYNSRKHSCEKILASAQSIAQYRWIVDMAEHDVERLDIGDREKDMAYHIIDEQKRVESCVYNLLNANIDKVGLLLNHTHHSLSELYSVSTPAMDMLAGIVRESPGVIGCRMMGGGFGGSIILASRASMEELRPVLEVIEGRGFGRLSLMEVKPADGLSVLIENGTADIS